MSSPENMRTGISLGGTPENYYTEIFYIIYLVLLSLLRRDGLKDSILYSGHNEVVLNKSLYDSGINFNLFSSYGIGVDLKPMVKELFKFMILDPQKNRYNVYYHEIVKLTNEVSNIIRMHDNAKEMEWSDRYAKINIFSNDDVSNARLHRLKLLLNFDNYSDDSDSMESNSIESNSDSIESSSEEVSLTVDLDTMIESDDSLCYCNFCEEFRKYILPSGVNISIMINKVLVEISKEV